MVMKMGRVKGRCIFYSEISTPSVGCAVFRRCLLLLSVPHVQPPSFKTLRPENYTHSI